MPLTIAVCEDEKHIQAKIARLARDCSEGSIVECYDCGEALLCSGKQYDIYILDIRMPGISGLEAAKRLRSIEERPASVIIFVTAMGEHMPHAFDVQAYHFLVKPIDEQKFISVLGKAVEECRNKQEQANIIVKSGGATYVVRLDDIVFAESLNKKVVIWTKNRQIEYYGKISEFDGNPDFYRCHRCYVVNMGYITRYDASTIRLTNGQTIPLAVKKYPQFVKAYMKYMVR